MMVKKNNKYPHRRVGEPGKPPFYIKLKAAYSRNWIGMWDMVKLRREANGPLIKGGNYREV